jgi:hypothetical protein
MAPSAKKSPGFGYFSRQGAKALSDRPEPVIPSVCEGSKGKDFSLCSKQGFLPSVEMTNCFSFAAFASLREIFRIFPS